MGIKWNKRIEKIWNSNDEIVGKIKLADNKKSKILSIKKKTLLR